MTFFIGTLKSFKNRPIIGRIILNQPANESTTSDPNVNMHDDNTKFNSVNVPYYATITKHTRISNDDTNKHDSTVTDDEVIPVTIRTNERKSSKVTTANNKSSKSSNKAAATLSDDELIQVAITHPSSSKTSSNYAR